VLFAFDLIEHDGDDLRDLPLIERKRRLCKLLGKRAAIRFSEHLTGDGPTVFEHVCRMGLRPSCRSGRMHRSRTWLKSKSPTSEAVRRDREEEWSGSIDVMRLDRTLGQSRHVGLAVVR
jgi:ATP-dependent DNA ligase